MNLDVLKSTIHFSKWRGSIGSMSLSFDVVPQGRDYIEIGDDYLFSASSYSRIHGKDRTPMRASVSITDDPEVLANLQPLFAEKDRPICGSASFYPERLGTMDSAPARLYFTVVVESHIFAEMVRSVQQSPAGATINIGLEGLEYGWDPDASHLIWKLDGDGEDQRPITSLSYRVDRFWTSESAIREENDRQDNAELVDSPDPEARKLAAMSEADKLPDPLNVLLKQCRSLLLAILVVGVAALFRFSG